MSNITAVELKKILNVLDYFSNFLDTREESVISLGKTAIIDSEGETLGFIEYSPNFGYLFNTGTPEEQA